MTLDNSEAIARKGVSLVRVSDTEMAISGDMVFASATRLRGEGERLLPDMGHQYCL